MPPAVLKIVGVDPLTRLATLATLSPKGARAVVLLFSCWAVDLVYTQDCGESLLRSGTAQPKDFIVFLSWTERAGKAEPSAQSAMDYVDAEARN